MIFFSRFRLLPLLVIVAALSLTVRAGNFLSGVALAQHEVDAEAPPIHETDKQDQSHDRSTLEGQNLPAEPSFGDESGEKSEETLDWRAAEESEFEYSEVRAELYEDLAERRNSLEEKEKELSMREALLQAGERELNQKLRELTSVSNKIESLLNQQSDEEKARIESLVKIYEGMKAKDAARIFNTLDMDVLIRVVSQMSERKASPVLAAMSPERARTVTILLAQQRQQSALSLQ